MTKTTKLYNLLKLGERASIIYRCINDDDKLYGYAYWDGERLESEDGGYYSIEDDIQSYSWDDDNTLIVWIEVAWR